MTDKNSDAFVGDDVLMAFRRTFGSPDGKKVLAYLEDLVYNEPVPNSAQPWRIIGRQDIVAEIKSISSGREPSK